MTYSGLLTFVAVASLAASSAFGQHVISARAGLIHYTEGDVRLGDKAIQQKPGDYPAMQIGDRLRTGEGRAEVLLTPGVTLRLAENTEIVLQANKLSDVRVEVLGGSALVEAGEVTKDTNIDLVMNGTVVEVRKRGVFRLDASAPPKVRVYDGEVTVGAGSAPMVVKEGREVTLASVPMVEKFRKEESDSFVRWAGRRSGYLATANMLSARQMRDNGGTWSSGGWYYNPYFGMFTYMPMNGMYQNFWGYRYYSPRTIYVQQPVYGGYNDPSFTGASRAPVDFGRSDIGSSGRSGGYSAAPMSSGGYGGGGGGGAAPAASSSQSGGGGSTGSGRGR